MSETKRNLKPGQTVFIKATVTTVDKDGDPTLDVLGKPFTCLAEEVIPINEISEKADIS